MSPIVFILFSVHSVWKGAHTGCRVLCLWVNLLARTSIFLRWKKKEVAGYGKMFGRGNECVLFRVNPKNKNKQASKNNNNHLHIVQALN